MLPKPILNRIAQAAVQELRAEHGIEPDFDEILWLHTLGEAQFNAGRTDGVSGTPAKAGNVWLWPLTILSADWIDRAAGWFAHTPLLQFWAIAFGLAYGRGQPIPGTPRQSWFERLLRRLLDLREERTLADLVDREEGARTIRQWVMRSGATQAEMENAVEWVMPRDNDNPQPAAPPGLNLNEIVHQLSILTGTDPEYWRQRTSMDETVRAFTQAVAIENARRNQGTAPKDALGMAISDFRKAVSAIIRAHKEKEPCAA